MPVALSRVRTNGIETTVATAGSGPAVLLLHGFWHTWQLWQEVLPALARTHRVIAPDQRWASWTPSANRRRPSWASTQAPRPRPCSPCGTRTGSAAWS